MLLPKKFDAQITGSAFWLFHEVEADEEWLPENINGKEGQDRPTWTKVQWL